MTKEEILYKESNFDEYEGGITGVFKAMDRYAKEMVIGYEIWLDAELNNDATFNYGKTPEQLFNLYLNHISKTTKE